MGKKKQEKLIQPCDNFSGWERAICKARKQIEAAQEKIRRLELSIQTFEEMHAKGEPFPSDEVKEQKEAAA